MTEFGADLAAACDAAKTIGITLESIVFPRNQFNADYLDACRKAGLIAWRGNERGRMYRAEAPSGQRFAQRGVRLGDGYLHLSGAHCSPPVARAALGERVPPATTRPGPYWLPSYIIRNLVTPWRLGAVSRENWGGFLQALSDPLPHVVSKFH